MTTRPELAVTICRHLHYLEWEARAPRTRACLKCQILALEIHDKHATH